MRLIAALALALFSACPSTGGVSPVVAYAIVAPGESPPPAWLVTDGSVLVARGQVGGEVGVLSGTSGWPLLGPVAVEAGETVVWRREPAERLSFGPGAPLPSWASRAFPPGMAERLEVAFE